jgi:hypothetical protein
MVQTWILHDSNGAKKAKRINRNDAKKYNEEGFGIFQTVQSFDDVGRSKENLVGVNAWAIDIDTGTKAEQMAKINSGLPPTMIVESKNGYHVYWACADKDFEYARDNYESIVGNRLVPFYGADKKAKDLARLLRVPGFYHLKEPNDPFLVTKIHFEPVQYKTNDMLSYYKDEIAAKHAKKECKAIFKDGVGNIDFWTALISVDQEILLDRLSGRAEVNGENYTFVANSNGNKNILVNGKQTSTFICKEGRIGSMDGGGPTIYQWLKWYGIQPKQCFDIINEIAPELKGNKNG